MGRLWGVLGGLDASQAQIILLRLSSVETVGVVSFRRVHRIKYFEVQVPENK